MADFRGPVKWMLFLSSYIPLYPILAYKHRGVQVTLPAPIVNELMPVSVLSLAWITLTVISLLFLLVALNVRRSKEPNLKEVKSSTSRNDLITTYILVYIFPFVVLDYSQLVNWFAFFVFFMVIGIIQVRSNQLFVNPVLAIAGYDIYEVDFGDEERLVLSKSHPEHEITELMTVELSNDVYIAV